MIRCSRCKKEAVVVCSICGDIFCGDCAYHVDYINGEENLLQPPIKRYDKQNHRYSICFSCWEKGELFREVITKVSDKHDEVIGDAIRNWKRISKS
jgi:hypothetical protein